MSLDPSNADRLEETLESTREGVRKLEIDAYRLRTNLTRLEAALEDSLANGDCAVTPGVEEALERPIPPKSRARSDVPATSRDSFSVDVADPFDDVVASNPRLATAARLDTSTELDIALTQTERGDSPEDGPSAADLASAAVVKTRSRWKFRFATPSVLASVSLHGALLLMILSITVATIVHEQKPFTTYVDLGDKPPEPAQVENLDLGQIAQLDETKLEGGSGDAKQLDFAGPLVGEVIPVDFESPAGPTSLGDIGSFESNPTDLGKLAPGNGGLGSDGTAPVGGAGDGNQRGGGGGGGGGRKSGPMGSAMFFGTKSKGDRFVFVVDNSSSMKNGRLEMALAELVKTVESLSTKQSFYVIFVSDQTYPMFFPQLEPDMVPATPLNKKRLIEWLPKAMLASGKNRELIKAMDMAAALRPHAVYLLWDGDLRYSDTVRLDVMTHLTAPNQWNFTVHTIGMGITSADAEQNLTAIAQAHGGLYRRVEVPTLRKK